MPTAVEDNVALARRWFEEVWGQRRTATVHELLLPTSVAHLQHGDVVGAEPFLAFHAEFLKALPDLRLRVEDTVAQGEHVVVRWSVAGTHEGKGLGCDPTGKEVRFWGMTWLHIRDGQLVEGWDGWDLGGLMQQLRGHS